MGRAHSPTDDLRDLRAVVADRELSTPERMVMVALILHRNGETGRVDPSIPTVVAESGLGRSTVIRVLAQLEACGWIEREQRHGVRTRYSVSTGPTTGLVSERDQSRSGTEVVPQQDQTRPTAGPERTKERTKERTDGADELWAVWGEEMNGAHLTLTEGRRKVLDALYREQLASGPDPLALFRDILAAVKASDHHMKTRRFQMPESLFKDRDRRETWAEDGRQMGHRRDPLMLSSREVREREASASRPETGSTHPNGG